MKISGPLLMKYTIFTLLIVLVCMALTVIFFGMTSQNVGINVNPATDYNYGWFYYDAGGHLHSIEKLPAKIPCTAGGKARIVRSITTSSRKDLFIDFYTHHQDLKVTLAGKELYEYSSKARPSWLTSYRSFHHLIKIPSFKSGELCIETKALISGTEGEFGNILIGNKAEIISSIIIQRLDKFIMGVILLLTGIVLTVSTNIYGKLEKDKTVLHLTIFMILTGIWQLEESRVTQIFIGFQPWHWCSEYVLRLFLLIVSFLFISDLFKNKNHPSLWALFICDATSMIVQIILQLSGKVQFAQSLIFTNFLYGLSLIYAFILVVRNNALSNLRLKIIFSFFMICSLISFFSYIIGFTKGSATEVTVSYALIFTFISLSLLMYQRSVNQVDSFKQAKLYEKLAFIDIATGVYNKTAWYTLTEQYDPGKSLLKNCCLIMFDMNNLKYMNDKFGHLLGDKVIGVFCKCLKEAVGDKGKIYRIGGDEFLCLCNDTDILKINVILSNFDNNVKNQKETEIRFTAAYGYSFFSPTEKEDFIKAHALADKDMYKNKQRIKSLQNNAL